MDQVKNEERTYSEKRCRNDHPKYYEMLSMLDECNVIKYASYRTAAKLRVLQRYLQMQHVRLGLIAGVFERHRLQTTENAVLLESSELEAILSDILFAAQKETQCEFDMESTTKLMNNVFMNIYDREMNNTLQVLSAKIVLVVLSSARLQEKVQYFFFQLADHNNCISRKKLKALLYNLTQITEYLSESFSFGQKLIPAAVASCFHESQGILGVTEDIFIGWLLREPPLVVWLPTFNRIQVGEMVNHSVKCTVCKLYPIIGLRYRCLYCLKYNQCQNCFFMGKVNKRHKLRHPMQEYCREITSKETTRAFLKMLKHKLGRSSSKLRYIPVQPFQDTQNNKEDNVICTENNFISQNGDMLDEMELSTQTVLRGSRITLNLHPQQELQSIIFHLEQENRQLQKEISKLCKKVEVSVVGECLEDHRTQIQAQIERLKFLKHYLLQIHPLRQPLFRLESTPLISATLKNGHGRQLMCGPGLENISPISKDNHEDDKQPKESNYPTTPVRNSNQGENTSAKGDDGSTVLPTVSEVQADDLSTWLGGAAEAGNVTSPDEESTLSESVSSSKERLKELHEGLDDILDKLQNILASSFSLEESFSRVDNSQLKQAATEMEDLLTSLIEGVEARRKASWSLGCQ